MPELPEVETTCRGVGPHLRGQRITALVIRQRLLRWPIPAELEANVVGQHLGLMERRAKYLLLPAGGGHIIIHLGMSGSLRLVAASEPAGFHDHVDIVLANGSALRLRDPRRFGAVLWIAGSPIAHPLLAQLGPEPLSDRFDGDYLYSRSHGRKVSIKQFLMDGKIVVGVGNIYANEALFAAGISPTRAAGRVSQDRYRLLASAVKAVLGRAIEHGGTTLRDFVDGSGKPGYFRTELQVYGREGLACVSCKEVLTGIRIGQRATVYCKNCQR